MQKLLTGQIRVKEALRDAEDLIDLRRIKAEEKDKPSLSWEEAHNELFKAEE